MAQTLKFGNKTWATKVGSTLAYNDENGNYKPLPFAFTRSTSATRVNKEGLIEVVTNDRPRIDYTDTSDGVLLLEKAATNLITYSEDFSNAFWAKSNSSITSNSAISPDGSLNADKLTANTSAAILSSTVISSGNTDVTVSFFAKSDTLSSFSITEAFYFGTVTNFNLSLVTSDNGQIEDYGSGWYRCSKTYTYGSGQQIVATQIKTGAIGSFYLFGGQAEVGNLSSYIPTQGSASTRVAETANNSGNSEVFNDSEGVLFANIAAFADTQQNRFLGINDGSNSNRVVIGYTSVSSNTPRVIVTSGGSTQAAIDSSINDIRQPIKIAAKYKLNSVDLWLNGFKVGSDTSAAMPIGLNNYSFDSDGVGGSDFYGKTKELGYYDTILTDLELEYLTSYRSWESMVNELNLNIIYNG
jgi:hypothetical protein